MCSNIMLVFVRALIYLSRYTAVNRSLLMNIGDIYFHLFQRNYRNYRKVAEKKYSKRDHRESYKYYFRKKVPLPVMLHSEYI